MGAAFGNDNEDAIASINITPFVDIILVVLIIFMVTTPIIMNPSIKIKLPKAVTGEETTKTQLNIGIDPDGKVLLNGKIISIDELTEKVKEITKSSTDTQAIIAADENVAHGKVVRVIDQIKLGGVFKFAISTEK